LRAWSIVTFILAQPDLTITKHHSGSFTQGSTGSYKLVVSNAVADPTYGTVTVVDNPPASETVTAMSGKGWTCDVPTATCTRADVLAPGASYPSIGVKVTVAADAPASVTNHASVSGGGDVNLANNTADDPTTILKQQFPLTVAVTGSGSVGSDSGGVTCSDSGGTCAAGYDAGTLVTLTATSGPHSTFVGWSGACTGTDVSCRVTMDQARDVTAVFTTFQPDLAIAKSHTGSFAQGGTGSYLVSVSNVGTSASFGRVTVSDQAPTGLTVTALSGDGWTCDVPSATCTRSDSLAPAGSFPPVTVAVSVAGAAPASLTNTATVSGGGDVNTSNNTATDPTTITSQPYPLTVTVGGKGSGSVSADSGAVAGCTSSGGVCTDTYPSGTVVTLTETTGTGSVFTGWGGACTGTSPTCQVTMDQARNVTATFDLSSVVGPIQYPSTTPPTLQVTLAGTGTGHVTSAPAGIRCSPDCRQTYQSATLVTLLATPDAGSVFSGFKGCDTVSGNRCTVRMTRSRSVVAVFDKKPAVRVTGRVSARVLRPGGSVTDRITVAGVGGTAIAALRLYGPFPTRAQIACTGVPAWRARVVVRQGTQVSPPSKIAKAGWWAFQATVNGVSTDCRADAQSTLGAPLVITGQGDKPSYVAARGDGGATPASVHIGSVGIDAPVGPIGIDLGHGALGTPTDIRHTGWWTDGAVPGASSGTVLVAGHVDSAAAGPGALFALKSTHVGDRVEVRARNGKTFAYRIVSVRLYLKSALPTRVWSRGGPAKLVLITCGGPFDPAVGHYRDNVVVTAVPA
jgi:uncharacterized repeat protein (TIGR02543 family)